MKRAVLALALLLAPALAGCLQQGTLIATATAPKEASGLTILVGSAGLRGDGQAAFQILRDGQVIYPPGGFAKGAIAMSGGQGSTYVPYAAFVVGNGRYDVVVDYDGKSRASVFHVEKWVEYVYLHPIVRGANVQVDVQLSRALGGAPQDRIIAEGSLTLSVWYRGLDGKGRDSNAPVKVVSVKTPPDETFTRVLIPKSSFSRGPGWYEVDPVFHNEQAQGNTHVPPDPSMAQRTPPWNWVCIDTCT